jgi:hypothetical protein
MNKATKDDTSLVIHQKDTLVELIPSYRLQRVAPRIHHLKLLFLLEIGLHTDPVDSHMNNLQKGVFFWFVKIKNKVISGVPNSPNDRANTHSNLNEILLRNTLEPIFKKISNILRRF